MRKLVSFILCVCVLTVAFAACAQTYKPGTYTDTAPGNNGDVVVSVTFSADALTAINIDQHSETLGISDAAIARIPEEIVAYQSLGVDSVSGATNTSLAIINAAAKCVEQAGGDVEALKGVVVEKAATGETVGLTTDLVVVGGGGAGMTSTIAATKKGLDVILLEKMTFMGGATSICGGAMIITGSELQKTYGVENDSPQAMYEDLYRNGHELNDPEKLTLYTQNVGATADWLNDVVGVQFKEGLNTLAEHSINRVANFEGSAAGLTKTLREAVHSTSAKVMLETRATDLIVEEGAVVGVQAFGSDGTVYEIRAKAVLLATGGFGNNQEMLPDSLKPVLYYGPESSTGDGHKMAQSVGAKFQMMEVGKSYPNGVEVAPGKGKSTINANRNAIDVSGIIVGKDGNRLWDERGANKDLLAVQLEQPDQTMYFFMDAASFEAFRTGLANTGINEASVEEWLENNGSKPPLFAHAETVDEVAAIAGIDAEQLKATIERFNGFVRNGVDEDFGRAPKYLQAEIGDGPYYIVEQRPRFATTLGGVCATNNLEVINEDGIVIPNLYAAGELIGGVQGDDSPPGSNVGWALTSGRIVGEYIADQLNG